MLRGRLKFRDLEEVRKEVEKRSQGEYTVAGGTYKGCYSKILIKHNTCGKIYSVTLSMYFSRGKKCPKCYGTKFNHKKSKEEYSEDFKKVSHDEYELMSPYVNSHEKISIKHKYCGRTFLMAPSKFLGRPHCPLCGRERSAKSKVKSTAWFSSELKRILGNKYVLLGEYTGSYNPIEIKHIECGNTYKKTPREIIDGHVGCPYCNRNSLGESLLLEFLDRNSIAYEYQKKFDSLMDKRQLSYDFYLPDYKVLIEYQGIQHYIPRSFGSKDKDNDLSNFVNQVYHDYLKKTFAESNDYRLVTIKYSIDTYEKISEYLSSILFCKAEESQPK